MADAFTTIRMSESRNIYVTLTPVSGTITISGGTITLYDDETGEIAGGVNAVDIGSNHINGATGQAWYLLQPSVLGLTPGVYIAAFLLSSTSGGVTSTDEPTIAFVVLDDAG